MGGVSAEAFQAVFQQLLDTFGPRNWWPADDGLFEVMAGPVLTQNSSWLNVKRAIANLKQADTLSAEVIVAAKHEALADWPRPSGYFDVKAKRLRSLCERFIDRGGYEALKPVPTDELRRSLLSVHGVGPETADDILL